MLTNITQELLELKEIVPKESPVYFLIGKVSIVLYWYKHWWERFLLPRTRYTTSWTTHIWPLCTIPGRWTLIRRYIAQEPSKKTLSWITAQPLQGANSQVKDALDPALNRVGQELGWVIFHVDCVYLHNWFLFFFVRIWCEKCSSGFQWIKKTERSRWCLMPTITKTSRWFVVKIWVLRDFSLDRKMRVSVDYEQWRASRNPTVAGWDKRRLPTCCGWREPS